MVNLILIAISLAMDCFAVSIAGGATVKRIRARDTLKVGLSFGLFQALMPLIGWFIGLSFKELIENAGHWVAFGLLCAIGIKMIYEALKSKREKRKINLAKLPMLFVLSIATSIDALAAGISFSLLDASLYLSVAIIGLFAFVFSISGYIIGNKIGHFLENKVELIGGIILIGIGIKILVENLV